RGAPPVRVHRPAHRPQRGRPAGQAGTDSRDERRGAIAPCRPAVVGGAPRGARPPAPVAVTIAGARDGAALVVPAAYGLGHLGFQGFLDDLPDSELDQVAPRVALGASLAQQFTELLACPLRGRYSRLHGDASSCRRRQPASLGFQSKQECIPVSISSKCRTWPPVTANISSRRRCLSPRLACWYRSRCTAAYSRKLARVTAPSSGGLVTVTSDLRASVR